MIMEEMTMKEFEEGLKITQTVYIPFGSVEEHGPHLPLSTDTIHAYEVGKKAAQIVPMFVAPPINYGNCRSTSTHPGTISISTATLKGILKDIVSSLRGHGIRNFLVLTGHAGGAHRMALQDAGEELISTFPEVRMAVVTGYDLAYDEGKDIIETQGDSHAGEVETSMLLNSHPHLVKGSAEREFPDFPLGLLVRNKRKYWPGGVWGDPSKASAEKGRLIEEILVRKVVDMVQRLENFEE